MKKPFKKIASIARGKLRTRSAKSFISNLDNGDYLIDIPIYHKSLQPLCSATFADASDRYGVDTAEKWSRDGCGIASATIIMDSVRRSITSHTLAPSVTHLCELYRETAYIPGIGWSHKGLVDFGKDFHLDAFNEPNDNVYSLCKAILDDWIPIVSVTLYFKGGQKFITEEGEELVKGKGGHLVVIKGFQILKKEITGFFVDDCQHPTLKDDEHSEEFVDIKKFNASYSGKTIYFRKAIN